MPAVAPFHRIGGRTEQSIVQEGQGFLQVGGPELLEDRPQPLAAADLGPQPGQLGQGRRGAAPAVEQGGELPPPSPGGSPTRGTPRGGAPPPPLPPRGGGV